MAILSWRDTKSWLQSVDPGAKLDEVPDDCTVYLFVYDLTPDFQGVHTELERMGNAFGKNLYVGFWNMADKAYADIAKKFHLGPLPAIVACVNPNLTNVANFGGTPFTKIDRTNVLRDPAQANPLLHIVYDYFISGDFPAAIKQAADTQSLLTQIKNGFAKVAAAIGGKLLLDNIDIEFGTFKLILTKPQLAQTS